MAPTETMVLMETTAMAQMDDGTGDDDDDSTDDDDDDDDGSGDKMTATFLHHLPA